MKFKFGDKVKVIDGFYEGLVGTVEDLLDISPVAEVYTVSLIIMTNNCSNEIKRDIEESNLVFINHREL